MLIYLSSALSSKKNLITYNHIYSFKLCKTLSTIEVKMFHYVSSEICHFAN